MSDRPRLFLIDDHRLLTDALVGILGENFEIIGTFSNGRDALESLTQLRSSAWPQAVVLDISMPDVNGIEVARRIKKILPRTGIVFLSMHTERPYVEAAFQAGANG